MSFVSTMKKFDGALSKRAYILAPLGVLLGLLLGHRVTFMKPVVTPIFAFLTLVNGMGVNAKDFLSSLKKPKALIAFALTSYIIIPLLALLLSSIFFSSNPYVVAGYILLYSIPTAVVGVMWSGIYKGNVALSITILIIATCLSPLLTPLSIKLFAHTSVVMDFSSIAMSLVWMVVIPSILGVLINMLSKGRCMDSVVPCLKPFSKLSLTICIMINVSQVAERLLSSLSPRLFLELGVTIVLTIIGFMFGLLMSRIFKLERNDKVSVVYASCLRNITASLVLAVTYFPPEASFPVISGIVVQQITASIVSHIVFKKEE